MRDGFHFLISARLTKHVSPGNSRSFPFGRSDIPRSGGMSDERRRDVGFNKRRNSPCSLSTYFRTISSGGNGVDPPSPIRLKVRDPFWSSDSIIQS